MRRMAATLIVAMLATPVAAQDTVVIRSNGPGLWRNPRLVEELRIGVLEGDDRYIFGEVSHLAVTSDGSIWVVDGQGPRVRVYDRRGRYLRDVYRTGAGPGELKGVMGIDITPDRRVAIWDLPNHRVSLYRENSEYVSAFSAVAGSWNDEGFQVDTAGHYWVFTSINNPACMGRYTARDGSEHEIGTHGPGCDRRAYLRYSAAGILMDTVYIPLPMEMTRTPSFTIPLPEGNAKPFLPAWDHGLSPHGYLVTAHSSRYAVNIVRMRVGRQPGGRGQQVTRIERVHRPIPVSPSERGEWQARADYWTKREPGGASSGVRVPDLKPAIRSVSVDSDGRIWVDRYVAAVKRADPYPKPTKPGDPPGITWREPRTFDVFAPTGTFLGTVVAPADTRYLLKRANYLWGVFRGEFDENYVVRYRLETN